jgi:hypothetical protein
MSADPNQWSSEHQLMAAELSGLFSSLPSLLLLISYLLFLC